MRPGILLAAAALLAAAGCSDAPKEGGAAQAARPEAIAEAARAGAQFRYRARETYRALLLESCPADPALRRAKVLAAERAAMREFEARIGPQPAALHLAFARSDIEHRQAAGELGCWNDDDPAFAQMHVRMARDNATHGLAALRAAAAALPALPAADPAKSAAFRVQVRELAERLDPLCAMRRDADNERILGAPRAEMERLRQRLRPTAWFLPLAIAEADVEYEHGNTVVECADPDPVPVEEMRRAALRETRVRIARIAALAGLGG